MLIIHKTSPHLTKALVFLYFDYDQDLGKGAVKVCKEKVNLLVFLFYRPHCLKWSVYRTVEILASRT